MQSLVIHYPLPPLGGQIDVWFITLSRWEIQHFVRQRADNSQHNTLQRASEFLVLDRRLEDFGEKLYPDFDNLSLSTLTLPKNDTDSHWVFALHCVYNLSVCVLHSSVVPVFSGMMADPQVPKRFLRTSAEAAIKHATTIVQVAATFLNICDDVSRLPGITGYALFVSCSVQFIYLKAQGKLQSHGIGHCDGALSLLQSLKEYSCPLQRMVGLSSTCVV